jgi:catechol 2,3-dioxygenase-like lactoylglutathione lyase family enzyme
MTGGLEPVVHSGEDVYRATEEGDPMLAEKVVFPAIAAIDLDRARTWYREKLGLSPSQEMPDGLIYACADGSAFLLYETAFAGTAKNTVAGWRVNDLEVEMEQLRSRGVEFEEYDLPNVKTTNGVATAPGIRSAWFADSEGNILNLSEM